MTVHLDHLVLGVPDFAEGLDEVAHLTGAQPAEGGPHPGKGTRNGILRLGPKCYLEILGPDPEQAPAPQPLRFGLADLEAPRLVAWCLRATDLEDHVDRAQRLGLHPTGVVSLSRHTPDSQVLRWRVAGLGLGPRGRGLGGAMPFLIDWAGAPHPADAAPDLVRLRQFSVLHPDAGLVATTFSSLGLRASVLPADSPGLEAILDTPKGRITMR